MIQRNSGAAGTQAGVAQHAGIRNVSAAWPKPGPLVWLSTVLVNVLSLALPIVLLQVYDRILPNQATNTLTLLILGLGAVLVIDTLLRFSRSYLMGWSAAQYEHRTNCAAVSGLLDADIVTAERESTGVHLDRLGAIQTLRGFHASDARTVLMDLPFVLMFVGLIAVIGGRLVLVPIGLMVALGALGFIIGKALRQALDDRAQLDDRRYSFIIQVLGAIQVVKAMAMEPLMQRRYDRLQEAAASASYRAALVNGLALSTGALFAGIAIVAVVAAGALLVRPGGLTLGELSACTLLTGRAVQPMVRALNLWTQFQSLSIAERRVDAAMALCRTTPREPKPAPALRGALELRDVSFRYLIDGPTVLDHLWLRIEPGQTIAITGDTGCGKSTLLNVLSGLFAPTAGQLLIDGNDAEETDLTALRSQIAYVSQKPVLFQGTVMENLTMFRGSGDLGSAFNIARQLGLDQIIGGFPAGYDTRVGDGAEDELPVGIKQLLVMARALVGKPRILLFDEANCSLDPRSDARLIETLRALSGETTIILASHRPSVTALASQTYRLQSGQLQLLPSAPAASVRQTRIA